MIFFTIVKYVKNTRIRSKEHARDLKKNLFKI